jgi:iron complex outermembrane receptor protein
MLGTLNRSVQTGQDGTFAFTGLPPGTYTVTAHMHSLTDEAKRVEIRAGETATIDFALRISPITQSITVTATGNEQTAFEAFQTVTTLDSVQLSTDTQPSLGELLNNKPGIAKRSFGPGTSRPVIRGFDGDRVLIMQDGLPTGALSSQSGDHGESVDPSTLERLEVVKGPATLLYGSNAIGGVVNAVTGHHQAHEHPHQGVRGYLTGLGGTTNGHAGGAGGIEIGIGSWMIWGGGGGQRTGDYDTPIGTVENSKTRISNNYGGAGWYGAKSFFDLGYRAEEGRYGVPFAGEFHGGHEEEADHDHSSEEKVDLDFRRYNYRVTGGFKQMGGFLDSFRLALNYSDWQHRELEDEEVGTIFNNKAFVYRGTFEQDRKGILSGSFGFQGIHRDYKTTGLEALAPPVTQNGFALFGLEEMSFERFRLQFGGRVENTQYDPLELESRSFTGFSGAAGIYIPAGPSGAVVANYSHSFRAPALEELYNRGPHIGNLTFEIGNPDLQRERSNGIDLAYRLRASRVRAEVSYFYYDIDNFVYLAPTGAITDGLIEAEYAQENSRFTGLEAGTDIALHSKVWLNLGLDYVNAKLKAMDEPLPRIPPLRGRAGLDFRFGGLSVRPELVMANEQTRIFETETPTAGYAVFNLGATYTLPQQHVVHVFSANLFNAGDRLYRNHLSFIKDLAPEIGRGFRFTYTMRFF